MTHMFQDALKHIETTRWIKWCRYCQLPPPSRTYVFALERWAPRIWSWKAVSVHCWVSMSFSYRQGKMGKMNNIEQHIYIWERQVAVSFFGAEVGELKVLEIEVPFFALQPWPQFLSWFLATEQSLQKLLLCWKLKQSNMIIPGWDHLNSAGL